MNTSLKSLIMYILLSFCLSNYLVCRSAWLLLFSVFLIKQQSEGMKRNHGNTSSQSAVMTLLFCVPNSSEYFGKENKM